MATTFDGDSASVTHPIFSFDDSSVDHGDPTTGTYYIEDTADNIGDQFGIGVWNSAHNTQYSIQWSDPTRQPEKG